MKTILKVLLSSTSVVTPIGEFTFSAYSDHIISEGPATVILANMPFSPILPTHMSVMNCRAIILKIKSEIKIDNIIFDCLYKGSDLSISGSSSGEGLECFEIENNNYIVSVGTEDIEYLNKRYNNLDINKNDNPVNVTKDGISIRLYDIPVNSNVSLHYLISWNILPEMVKGSTWFASDQYHENLLNELFQNK